MNRSVSFTKMQGAGNDFIVLNDWDGRLAPEEYPILARALCLRRVSLGADGLIIVTAPRQGGDYAMKYFNSDGTAGEMCGNGARCIARYGYDHGLAGSRQRIETTAGMVLGERIGKDSYRIRLNDPSVMIPAMTVEVQGQSFVCSYAELGDPGIPHAVVHLEDWDSRPTAEVEELGRALCHAAVFARGANVTFWKGAGIDRVKAVTFERGVEELTLACGTGAGSTAASLCLLGVTGAELQLDFPGGTLFVRLTREGSSVRDLFLTGPAVVVAEGTAYLPESYPEE